MKIVDRKTFLAMPAGTVFAKYQPCYFEGLEIKGDSLSNDYCFQQIVDALEVHDSGEFGDKLFESQEKGTSVPMDFYCQGRDGGFDDMQLFAVFEKQDVEALIERLRTAVRDGYAAAAERQGHLGCMRCGHDHNPKGPCSGMERPGTEEP